MPDALPEVTQEFDADVQPYLDGIEEMITATDAFRDSVAAALRDVLALEAAIDSLPDEKTIHVNVETSGMPENVAANVGNVGPINTEGVNAEEDALRNLGDIADTTGEDLRNTGNAADEMGTGFQRAGENTNGLEEAFARLDEILKNQGSDWEEVDRSAGQAAETLAEVGLSYREMVEQGMLPADSALRDSTDSTAAATRDLSESMIEAIAAAAGTSGAEERLFAVSRDGTATTVELTAATKDHASAAAEEAIVLESLRGAQDSYDAGMDASIAGQLAAARAARALEDGFAEVADGERLAGLASESLAEGLAGASVSFRGAAAAAQSAGAAVEDSGNSARRSYGWWGLLTKEVTLFGGVLGSAPMIGSVALWHIALDGLFESAVALGEALAALTVGIASMVPASEDIYTHLKSVQTVNSALGSSIPPLTGKFQALGQAMAAQTVEAYGGALNLVNQNGTTLAHVAEQVVTGLDDWIAKLDIWKQSQSSMGGMLESGVGFLHQFEQVVDNVGLAIDNLIKADPGTAHYLMDLVVGFTKVLDVITEIPTPILMAALALHSFMLWGGLLTTGLGKLAGGVLSLGQALVSGVTGAAQFMTQLGLFGRVAEEAVIPLNDLRTAEAGAALESSSLATRFVALATNPFVWVAAAAVAIGYLVWQTNQASQAAKNLTESIDKGVGSAAPSQAIMLIANDVGTLNAKMTQTTQAATQSADAMGKNWREVSSVNTTMHQASNDTNMYQNEINKLTGEQKNLFDETGRLIGQGYTYSQSLALMDLAGVKTGDSLALMRQKVDNLITGYQNLGVQGGILANGVAAVSFAAELQNSKIQQLTQSYTTFLGVVTGGESAFVTAEQGLQGLSTAETGAGAAMTVTNGKTSLQTKATSGLGSAAASTTTSIGGLSQSSLQLTSTWQQAITNGGNLINSLLTQSAAAGMGARGYTLVSGAAKDYLQQLLPMAKGSQLATSELYALAQVAGYQGADSFQALSKWIGNTSNAGVDLQNKVTALTVASAGLTADVNNLANAISGNLNAAMAAAIAQAHGGQAAFNNFANAAVHAHGTTDGMSQSASALARELIATTGDTSAAHRMFDTFSISLGLSRSQADSLWSAVEKTAGGLNNASNAANRTTGAMYASARSMSEAQFAAEGVAAAVNNIPSSKYISITEGVSTYQISAGGLASPHAAGYRVPGYGGGDIHPAMLEGGEAVVPKELTPAVAPFLKAHGVPGFAGGGVMGSDGGYGSFGGGGDRPIHVHVEMNGTEVASALIPSLTAANGKYAVRNSGKATGVWKPV